jgi:hypothetical protein
MTVYESQRPEGEVMSIRTTLIAVALALLGSATAWAADLFSPSLYAVTGQFLECRIVNKSTVAQIVRIQMFSSDGAVVSDTGNQTVAASGLFGISLPSEAAGTHCRFSTGAAKSLFRASIDVLDGAGGGIVVALPAE